MLFQSLLLVGSFAAAAAQDVTSSQFWHERYHGLLSMSAYGDFETECPRTFTREALLRSFPESTSEPFTVLSKWGPTASGLEGYNVVIPEMDKVVMVFKGLFGWENLNMTAVPVDEFYIDGCENCTAHSGAYTAYLEAKELTNDWAEVKAYVASTGHQWSITGHGFGGMVAQVASLDLGWRGLCRWTHNHGAARVFNTAAAEVYNSLFQGEAGQRTVANEDIVPTIIPESDDYTFTLQGFHIYGTNETYGQNFDVCAESATDPRCLGGNVALDHGYYYTPIGFCGHPNYFANLTHQASVLSLGAAAYAATSTGTAIFNASTLASTVSATPTSATVDQATISAPAQTTTAAPEAATTTVTGKAGRVGAGVMGVVAVVGAVWLV